MEGVGEGRLVPHLFWTRTNYDIGRGKWTFQSQNNLFYSFRMWESKLIYNLKSVKILHFSEPRNKETGSSKEEVNCRTEFKLIFFQFQEIEFWFVPQKYLGSWVLILVNAKVLSYFRSSGGNVRCRKEFMMILGNSLKSKCDHHKLNYLLVIVIVFLSDAILFFIFAYFFIDSGVFYREIFLE